MGECPDAIGAGRWQRRIVIHSLSLRGTEMPEQPGPADVDIDPVDTATQPEDDDPLELAGDPSDPPQDTGRGEGVSP
jgi:hypothetical protein